MAKNYEMVTAVVEVEGNFYKYVEAIPKPGTTPEAFLSELLQNGDLPNTPKGTRTIWAGYDLALRAKRAGKIRQAFIAAKEGKVSVEAVKAKLAEVCGTPEFIEYMQTEKNPDPYKYAEVLASEDGIELPKGEDEESVKIIKAVRKEKMQKAFGKDDGDGNGNGNKD